MRKKQLYMQNQLEEQGVKIGKLEQFILENGTKITFNIPVKTALGAEYRSFIRDLDIQEFSSRYKWTGLPSYISGWTIENMLYWRSSLVGYFDGDTLKVLPYAQNGDLNIYSMPSKVYPISYTGTNEDGKKLGIELVINRHGGKDTQANGALLYDRPPFFQGSKPLCRGLLNDRVIDDQSAQLERLQLNLAASFKKGLFTAEDKGQAESIKRDIKDAYEDNSPFIVVKESMQSALKNGVFSTDIPNESQQHIETYQSLNNIRKSSMGYCTNGAFQKKERVITSEKDNENSSSYNMIDIGLEMRQLWLQQLREIYPTKSAILDKISVEIRGGEQYAEFNNEFSVQRDIPEKQ